MESWRRELYTNELYHHGIPGQKWGTKNGPPYPLDKATHKAVIKNAVKEAKKENPLQKKEIANIVAKEAVSWGTYGASFALLAVNPVAAGAMFAASFATDLIWGRQVDKMMNKRDTSVYLSAANKVVEEYKNRSVDNIPSLDDARKDVAKYMRLRVQS